MQLLHCAQNLRCRVATLRLPFGEAGPLGDTYFSFVNRTRQLMLDRPITPSFRKCNSELSSASRGFCARV